MGILFIRNKKRRRIFSFIVLPTWIFMRMMKLPKDHVYRRNKISLYNWWLNATNLEIGYSLIFWFGILIVGFIIFNFIKEVAL